MIKHMPAGRHAVVLALCILTLAGCGGDDDDPAPTTDAPEGMPPDGQADTSGPAPGTVPGATATTEFDGDWLLACSAVEGGDDHQVNMLTIAGDTVRQRLFTYVDAACTQPSVPAELDVTYSIVYPGGSTSTSLGQATHVDVTPETILTDGRAPTAQELQQIEAFGAFDTEYDILLRADGALYGGDTDADPSLDGTTPERRYVALDPEPLVLQ